MCRVVFLRLGPFMSRDVHVFKLSMYSLAPVSYSPYVLLCAVVVRVVRILCTFVRLCVQLLCRIIRY